MGTPSEFRYRDHSARDDAIWLLFVAAVIFVSSLVSGTWGIAALAHANWLDTNDLPGDNATVWGIGLLCAATLQGITALLIFSARGSASGWGSRSPSSAPSCTSRSSAPTRCGPWSASRSTR